MFCRKCGTENPNNMNFCTKCGTPLKNVVDVPKTTKSSKRQLFIGMVAIVVIAACAIGTVSYINSQKKADYNAKMEEANRYMQEVQYEKAEMTYMEAIDIQPKEEDAYTLLTDLYISQGRYQEAIETMETAKKEVGSGVSEDFDVKYKQITKGKASPQYQAYFELVKEYQKKYGEGYFDEYDLYGTEMKGLSLVKLFDFNDDGNDELILVYYDYSLAEETSMCIRYEVWAWQNEEPVNILPSTPINYTNGGYGFISAADKDNVTYLRVSNFDEDIVENYLRYDGTAFQAVYEHKASLVQGGWYNTRYYIEGKEVSEEEFNEQTTSFSEETADEHEEAFEEKLTLADCGKLFVRFNFIDEAYGNRILAETERIITLLKGPKIPMEGVGGEVLSNLPDFDFSSGAGAWGTNMTIEADGTFTGTYHDSNMGEIGPGYPNGTQNISLFSGTFTDVQKIDEYTYKMTLESLETEKTPGEEWIEDGIRYIASEPYGVEEGKIFELYLPGKPISTLSERYISWVMWNYSLTEKDTILPFHGLYNIEKQYGFGS